jgi:DNA-binding Xre family transcriptional regulator
MPIIINLDVMLAKRKMSSAELAEKLGITTANLSIIKTQPFLPNLSTIKRIQKIEIQSIQEWFSFPPHH